MGSTIVSPTFCDVDTWRDVVKNNALVEGINFTIVTNETWLPLILSQTDFFSSNAQVKKNRPDLWRDLVSGEEIKINKWAFIKVFAHDHSSSSLERQSS